MSDPIPLDVEAEKSASLRPQGALTDHLEELFTEVNALAIRLRQARRGQMAGELSTGGDNVLRTLSRFGPQTVPQIARLNCTSRQNVQTIVNRLTRQGCVEFAPNPAHKLSELVRLTDRGQASVDAVSRNEEGNKERLLLRFTKDELDRSSKLLRSIREVLTTAEIAPPRTELAAQEQGVRLKRTSLRSQAKSLEAARRVQPERVDAEKRSFEAEGLPVNLL